MEQAEAVGAQFITGVRVDAIHQQGRVTGVQAGEDVLEANVVVLADGVNSLLGRSIGLVQKSNLIITPSGLKSSFHCQLNHSGSLWRNG
jgi:electron transfer flavoprotein-quinone oxidoreductase